jgi:AAA domain
MPTRPPLHRPQGHDASARARVERERQRQALRPGPVERGYDGEWQRARKMHLAKHPSCSTFGCSMPATDVDHIQSVQDRPDLRLEPSNFRSLCKHHHSQRTARDQGFARTGEANSVNAPLRGARHPEWLRPSIVPLTLVCGAPGAGKSTYVEQRRGHRDMVLDLDAIIAKLSGLPLYNAAPSWRDAALRWRNGRLSLLGYVSSRWPLAWLIVSEPRAHWRQWWVDKMGARVVVLETPAAVCVEHIVHDPRRSDSARARALEGVHWWWLHYQRRDDDMIIRPNARATTGRALLQHGQGSS